MSFIEQFETIKKKMDKLDTSSLPDNLAIQINLTDEDCGGVFYISNVGGEFRVEPYDYYDHTAMLTGSAKEFLRILGGKLDATDAYFRGLLLIEGDVGHAQALAGLMKKTEKKPAAKKPTAKKPAAKKPAAKKPAAKKPTAKKPAAKKPATKKTAK